MARFNLTPGYQPEFVIDIIMGAHKLWLNLPDMAIKNVFFAAFVPARTLCIF